MKKEGHGFPFQQGQAFLHHQPCHICSSILRCKEHLPDEQEGYVHESGP